MPDEPVGSSFSSAFNETLAALQGCFDPAYKEGYWTYGGAVGAPIQSYALHLFSQLVTADGRVSESEYAKFRALFGSDATAKEVSELLRWKSNQAPHLLRELPTFIKTIVRYDQLHGTSYGLEAIDRIVELGELIVASGELLDERAVERLRDYKSILNNCLQQALAGGSRESVSRPNDRKPLSDGGLTLPSSNPEEAVLEGALNELDGLVGLSSVKDEVRGLVNLLSIRRRRIDHGLPNPEITLHMVFTGNPGTGKTTVARILSRVFRGLGILSAGSLVETDRSGLVAGYVGQTALRVREVVRRATGGVLFVDEAYSLASSRIEGDYGAEAIETLLKQMEDHRDDLVVITAGYPDKMNEFLSSNPGLRSRFTRFISFPDYSSADMLEIFVRLMQDAKYTLTPDARNAAAQFFDRVSANRSSIDFGNARFVRTAFEDSLLRQSNRLATMLEATATDLCNILPEDLPVSR